MKTVTIEIENKVDQFLAVIDGDIQLTRKTLARLDQLRSLVIKRDDAGLSKILSDIQAESGSYRDNELKKQSIRYELGMALGCRLEQVTLTMLEAELSGEKKAEVSRTKSCLQMLGEELKKEYSSTAMLLSECARFNRVLLKNIFEFSQRGMVTYNPKGSAERQGNSAFVNLQF